MGLLGRSKAFVKVRGLSEGKSSWEFVEEPMLLLYGCWPLCGGHRRVRPPDSSPLLRNPEQNMSVLEAMVVPGDVTQSSAVGSPLQGQPRVVRPGFPFLQVNPGDRTTFTKI